MFAEVAVAEVVGIGRADVEVGIKGVGRKDESFGCCARTCAYKTAWYDRVCKHDKRDCKRRVKEDSRA